MKNAFIFLFCTSWGFWGCRQSFEAFLILDVDIRQGRGGENKCK